jgi:hypothetical protein
MKRSRYPIVSTVFSILLATTLAFHAPAARSTNDVIVEWNQLAQPLITGQPFSQTRQYAMLHIAMADAVVAIEGGFQPYRARIGASRGASAEAAAAQAARDVLVALIPASQATFDAALAARLDGIPPGRRSMGVEVGRKAAAAVLSWRQNDGFAAANPQPPPFLASTLPGIWKPTASGPAVYSLLGTVTPFGILTPYQFLPRVHPQLESPDYARDFNEVKEKGRSTNSTRTPEQTRFAQLFAGVGTFANVTNAFRLWHNVARDVSNDRFFSLAERARLYALLTASIHDSVQTSQSSKFVYRLWRPETAIDQAATDNNAATEAVTGWVPLLPTPPYPSHASNMACIGAGAARMLANVFGGDAANFSAIWYSSNAAPTVVHSQPYQGFWAMALDEGDSRIWGGIHFRFELTTSQESCAKVADFIHRYYMTPRHSH